MRVDGDGRLIEAFIQYDIGSFATDPRKAFKVLPVVGNVTVKLFQKYLARFDDVFGFGGGQSDRLDGFFQFGFAQRQ